MTQNARGFEVAIRYEARRIALKEELYEDAVKRGLSGAEAVAWSRAEATRLASHPEPKDES